MKRTHTTRFDLKKLHRLFIWLFVCLLLCGSRGICDQLRVFELKHRTADEIVRIVKPLLGPEDTISGRSFTVIVTAAPETLSRIESVIRTLDRPSRRLLIIVVQGEDAREALDSVDVSGNVSIGDDARIEFGRNPQPEGSVSVTGRSARSTRRDVDIQRLRAQEGLPAFFYVGQLVPVSTQTVDPRSHGSRVVFKEARTGFEVVPRLSGDRFILDIASRRESTPSADRGGGVVQSQQIQTQVHGRLNEWIDIGGVLGSRQRREAGVAYRDETSRQNRQSVFLTIVEVAD